VKKLLVSYVLFLFLLIWNQPIYALTVKIDPDFICLDITVKTFDVSVVVEDVSDLASFQFDIEYDPSVVTPADVVVGDFLGSTGRTVWSLPASDALGKLTYGVFTVAPNSDPSREGPSGNGILAIITFTVKNLPESDSELELGNVRIMSTTGVFQPYNTANSSTITYDGYMLDWKGTWKSGREYRRYDAVQYNGTSYICLQDHISSESEVPALATDLWNYFTF